MIDSVTAAPTVGRFTPPGLLLGLVLSLPFGGTLAQTTIELTPMADASLFEEGALANGAGDHLFTGITALGAGRRALVRFDLTVLPTGAVIERAELAMNMSRTISGTLTVRLHALTADWGEGSANAPGQEGTGAPALPGDATWDERQLGLANWNSPGGDFEPSDSARAAIRDPGGYRWSSSQMAADVQRWLDAPGSNFGWIVIGNEAAGFGSAKRFDSREHPNAALRPRLTLTYSGGATPPLPARPVPTLNGWALGLLAGAMICVAWRARRRRRGRWSLE